MTSVSSKGNMTNNTQNTKKTRLLFWFVLLAAIILFSLIYKPKKITLAVEENFLSCSYTSSEPLKIHFSDILSINLQKDLEIGEYISGIQTKDHHFGVWKNDQFGEYKLCIEMDVHLFLVIFTPEDKYVINFESEDSTESFYKAFMELLEKKQEE